MFTSSSINPHKRLGRTVAILCFVLTGMLLFCGAFFVVAAATADLATLPLDNVTNNQLAILAAATALIPAVIALLMGYQIWRVWGSDQRQEKAGPRTAVGCLLTSSLGCGLWAILSAAMTLLTGRLLMNDAPAGMPEVLIGASGFVIAIIVMLLIAGYLWRFYVRLQPAEQERIQNVYFADLQAKMTQMGSLEAKAYVQTQTVWLLPQIDPARKRAVIQFLYDYDFLRGEHAIQLSGANLKQVDLRQLELPHLNLQGADLQGANLQNTNLYNANLRNTNLRQADCRNSNFYQADLSQADLRQAELAGAIFRAANFTAAKVTAAQLKVVGSLEQAIGADK